MMGLGILVGTACEAPAPEPRNVLVIAIDTLRPDRLSHRGHSAETSPNLDVLAAESWLFEDAQSPSPWTAPALLSLMTSLYPEAHGVVGFPNPGRMADEVTTLAEVLRAAGYRTAAFTEGGYAKGEFGLAQGFEHFPANPGDDESHGSNLLYPSRIVANVDRAIDWLGELDDAPFLLFFHTYEVHFPYRAPTESIERFRPGYSVSAERAALTAIAERWDRREELTTEEWDRLLVHHLHCQLLELPRVRGRAQLLEGVRGRIRDFEAGRVPLSDQALGFVAALYDAEIHFMDEQIGRLLGGLERAGYAHDTVVVAVSDHGEGLGQHRRIQHGTHLHDELTRALLLLRIPGTQPRRVTSLARTVDVVPTVLEALRIEGDAAFQGSSLLSEQSEPRFAYASARALTGEELRWRAIRSERFTLLEDGETGEVVLFDRRDDPGETRDVASRFPEDVEQLRAALRRTVEDTRSRAGMAEAVRLPAESEAELRALGYIE
jgi:arylsulfatase A-like enzyme